MSLTLGVTYERGDGATFIAFSVTADAYEGEITDERGTRRYGVSLTEHPEWKSRAERAQAEVPKLPEPVLSVVSGPEEGPTVSDNKGERKVKPKR